ncbi:hypothetical protein [Patulibacter sp.]|uniref:hypothetical protein n=1 Tax=Patulibacter sp. TaxID=1912859 RepID=UPI002723A6EF|nr:hypothetical protein [Patulibacter sp.]MDO9410210.1 hypothetical protein [Patulibacter sp.]
MLDSHAPLDAVRAPSDPFLPLQGRSALEALRFDAGVIHHELRRIADDAAAGGTPEIDELDRVATAVRTLHLRILEITRDDASASFEDVVAARRSIHRSLAIVQEVADEVLAG